MCVCAYLALYVYIRYSFEQKSSALQTCSFWGLDASSLGGGGSLWEFFWTPKGRWKPFPTFHVGTGPKTFQSIWSLYDVFVHQCLFFSMFRVVFVDIENPWSGICWYFSMSPSRLGRYLPHLGAWCPGARAFYPPNSWIQHWEVHFIALKPWKWKQLPMIQNLAPNPW